MVSSIVAAQVHATRSRRGLLLPSAALHFRTVRSSRKDVHRFNRCVSSDVRRGVVVGIAVTDFDVRVRGLRSHT
jgi:hypothetical protein